MRQKIAGKPASGAGGGRILRRFLFCGLVCVAGHSAASARTITFAGREWTVRSNEGGPGPNRWSDSTDSVWVDGDGLHLKVRNVDGAWYCAEVTSVLPTRHGMHRFHVASRVDLLDRNIVASPFLYKDDSHEIDIEFSKWRKASGNNAQFVVQPYQTSGNIRRYEMTLKDKSSTHYFNWLPDSIHFRSFEGHHEEAPRPETVIQDWTYTGSDNPSESDVLRIHINLWLINGAPPSDGQEAEFVVSGAEFPEAPSAPANVPEKKQRKEGATDTSGATSQH